MHNRINTNNPSNPLHFEVRKVQQQRNGSSLMVTLPTRYIKRMSLKRGDLLKMYLGYGDKSLIAQKVDLSPIPP
jgi:antitoxin component of MazEF toxin-antitoxin module